MKKIKLTESDLERIVRRVVMEQSVEMTNIPSKGLKPLVSAEKINSIKSQADVLAKDTEMIKQTLETLKSADPEAYYMLTRGEDPIKKTVLGDLVTYGSLFGMIYGIVQELRGR